MNISKLVLPGLALGAAGILIVPGEESYGFAKIGGSLGLGERDFRVYDNFADPASNNNTNVDPMFPGYTGVEVAIWKGHVEWGSGWHGDGTGDPTQANIGSGFGLFDPLWSGNADGIGGTNDNVVSAISGCSGSTLAYTETPISNGWRIRFCDNWTWADGPGTIGGQTFDIQGTACHEYGHAIGLGHSSASGATMRPSISVGSTAARSITGDDIAGAQCIYGTAGSAPDKPTICEVEADGSTVNIKGEHFGATGNEVWFTNASVTTTGADPRVRALSVPSSEGGTLISLTIPAGAGPGDLVVRIPGGTTGAFLSNAFPFDPNGTISAGSSNCGPFHVALLSPSTVEALVPGTSQFLTATGSQLDMVTGIELNTELIPGSSWTIVNPTTITIDLPQAPSLGSNTLFFHRSGGASAMAGLTVVAPTTPKLQLGTGDPANVITQASGVDVIVGGEPGEQHWLYYSTSNVPSNASKLCLSMGNNFTEMWFLKRYTVPAKGWFQTNEPYAYGGPPVVLYVQSIDFGSGASPKFGVSNLQSVTVTQ